MFRFYFQPFNSGLENSKCSEFSLTSPNKEQTASSKTFKLVISRDCWKTLLTKKVYKNKTYAILKKGKWTNVFAQKIYEQTKIQCAFSFQRAKICKSNEAKNYVTFKADCKESGGFLVRKFPLIPGKYSDAIFDFNLKNAPSNFRHEKRSHLRGNLRSQVACELLDSKKTAKE